MVMRIYTVPGRLYWDDTPETEPQFVFIFVCGPYWEQIGLHPYHKHRRVWSKGEHFGRSAIAGKNRTRQVERWCQLSGFKCEKGRFHGRLHHQ